MSRVGPPGMSRQQSKGAPCAQPGRQEPSLPEAWAGIAAGCPPTASAAPIVSPGEAPAPARIPPTPSPRGTAQPLLGLLGPSIFLLTLGISLILRQLPRQGLQPGPCSQ